MLVFPNNYQATWESNLSATPSTAPGTTVTASGTINTKGAYAQLIASTTYDSYGFWLQINSSRAPATDTSQLLDIALGAAASEVDILSNFLAGYRGSIATDSTSNGFFIPLFIPKGARVSARIQGVIVSDTLQVTVYLNGARSQVNGPIFNACDTYGANTADSGGTAHTPGNTGGESTDAVVGTATRDYKAIMLGLGSNLTLMSGLAYHWEFTDGTNTLCEWSSSTANSETLIGPEPSVPFPVNIANTASLQIQAECSGTGEAHDVAYYLFY